jgi:phosphatidate cytidylyltransferase
VDQQPRKDSTEGVRIIGAQEAAEALERDDVAKRRPDDAPRYGDRPESPPEGGPRPAIRFPLSNVADPSAVDRPPLVPPTPPRQPDLPHWSEPPTGEVPKVLASDAPADDDLEAWSSFTSSQPRWRGEGPAYESDYDDFSRLADDDTRVGALDNRDRPDPDDFFSFDDFDEVEPEAAPAVDTGMARPISSDPRRSATRTRAGAYERPAGAGRDLPTALGVGLGFGVLALVLFALGPKYTMALVTAVIVLAAVELFNALRKAGHQPATLLGIAACGALVLAAYWKHEPALPLVLFLTVVFGLLWYLTGAGGSDRPVAGLGVTLLGVVYVGMLGSFAALMLAQPNGLGVLLAAVIGTVGYDVGGYFIGRSTGTRALSDVSPNKTIEGLIGGCFVAIVAVTLVCGFIGIHPLDSTSAAFKVGMAIAVAAPLGDLAESMLKRDLGVKDMGDILPGHGGMLDRFDALLFVLPTVYYVAQIVLD